MADASTKLLTAEDDSAIYSGTVVLSADPAPPLSERALLKDLETDDFAWTVQLFMGQGPGRRIFLLEYSMKNDPDPMWIGQEFIRYATKYPLAALVVETVAYQQFLATYLKLIMDRARRYVPLIELVDRRKKHDRIRQAFNEVFVAGMYYVRREHQEFIDVVADFPMCSKKDLIDSAALGKIAVDKGLVAVYDESEMPGGDYEPRGVNWRSAP